jgi:hypothetical protein
MLAGIYREIRLPWAAVLAAYICRRHPKRGKALRDATRPFLQRVNLLSDLGAMLLIRHVFVVRNRAVATACDFGAAAGGARDITQPRRAGARHIARLA